MSLNEYIQKHAEATPQHIAIVTPDEQITYAELWARISDTAAELEREGVAQSRKPYVFRASQNIDFIVTYCAVHQNSAVAVPLEQNIPQEMFDAILSEASAYDFPEGSADLLYTSGSTGKAKGVILSDTALTSCAENFIHDHHYTSELVFIISGPLSHIASLFKIHPTLMAGGTVYVINGMKEINAFYRAFSMTGRRFASFLVPASIRMLLQLSRDQLMEVADRVEFIETGAAPITESDMRDLSEVLPHSHLYNTLGGTEIGAVCTYDFNDGKYMAGCVGRPMLHASVSVDDEGNISCGGPTIMTCYINEPERTASVLHDGVFRTSDRGYFDEDGMLHLLGRSDDAINVGGFKADPIEIENTVMTLPYVDDCICIAVPHPIAGQCLKLLYVVKDGCVCKSRDIAFYLKEHLEAYKVPSLYEKVDTIRQKSNGKKDRQAYK